jgi:hypothetical protein
LDWLNRAAMRSGPLTLAATSAGEGDGADGDEATEDGAAAVGVPETGGVVLGEVPFGAAAVGGAGEVVAEFGAPVVTLTPSD